MLHRDNQTFGHHKLEGSLISVHSTEELESQYSAISPLNCTIFVWKYRVLSFQFLNVGKGSLPREKKIPVSGCTNVVHVNPLAYSKCQTAEKNELVSRRIAKSVFVSQIDSSIITIGGSEMANQWRLI